MRRKALVVCALFAVSATMVYGTWLAADDMRAKPLVAHVTTKDGFAYIENTGEYAWQDVRLTINGEFVCTQSEPAPPGAVIGVNLIGCRTAAGEPLDWPDVRVRDVAITVSRVPRFPLLNRARTASGTFALE